MTRNEFVTQRTAELPKRNVAAADVVEEYQQHVSFKLADGYSEEEIAARPGQVIEVITGERRLAPL